MTALPANAVVLGTGGGALSIASELGLAKVSVTVADFPQFAAGLDAIDRAGAIEVTFRGDETRFVPIAGTSRDPRAAVAGAPLVIISVPSFGHVPFATAIAPALMDGQTVIWAGEGGGALSLIAALRQIDRRPKLLLAETNSLPYAGATVKTPGTVGGKRKTGGTFIAGVPTAVGESVHTLAVQIWPWIKPAQNAWETLLVNFNAIDHVATMMSNLGQIENRRDMMKLWGEGLSPGVGRLIGAVDGEYANLRRGVGLKVEKKYLDYLVEQGLVDRKRDTVHETILASVLAGSEFKCGPDALQHRFIAEDVPYSLVLASSLGDELGIDTPVIDGLISLASTAAGHDFCKEGRTLRTWGLEGKGRAGLIQAVEEGWW